MKIINVQPNSDEWLLARKNGIGGSDASTVVGLNKWSTPYQLWKDKTDLSINTETNEVLEFGHYMEDWIRKLYTKETGNNLDVPCGIIQDDEYPFMLATIDGFIPKTDIMFEAKICYSRYEFGDFYTDDVPVYYNYQAQHGMHVTKTKETHLMAWFDRFNYGLFIIKADPYIQEMLIKAEKEFWNCVVNKTPPPLELMDVDEIYKKSQDNPIIINQDCLNIIEKIKETKSLIKQAEIEISENELWIKEFMKENDRLVDADGNTLVSWKTTKPRTLFDTSTFKKEHLEIYKNYIKEGKPSRPFKIL